METWIEELKKEFSNITPRKLPKKTCNIDGSILVFFLFLILTVAGILCYREVKASYSKLENRINQVRIPEAPRYDDKINELEERVDNLSDRTWLMSLVINNNVHKAKHNVGNWIYIESDWKIEYPENLNLSPKEKELLKSHSK